MQYIFASEDCGGLVFGQKLLQLDPTAQIQFLIGSSPENQVVISENDFWRTGLEAILKNHTRFGRVALVCERKNKAAVQFADQIDLADFDYQPQQRRRHTENTPRISTITTQALWELANEGLADTVEFRRLARKQLRKAKQANVDTIFFLESVFGESKTRSILKHIVGSQMKLFFPSDFFDPAKSPGSFNRSIQITTNQDLGFIRTRTEAILKTKIKATDVVLADKQNNL